MTAALDYRAQAVIETWTQKVSVYFSSDINLISIYKYVRNGKYRFKNL